MPETITTYIFYKLYILVNSSAIGENDWYIIEFPKSAKI